MKSLKKAIERRQITSNPVSIEELMQLYQVDSMKALLIKMGPFVPSSDAFIFKNRFDLTADEFDRAASRIPQPVILELAHQAFMNEIRSKLEAINIDPPGFDPVSLWDLLLGVNFLTEISFEKTIGLLAKVVEKFSDPLVSSPGFCGGMAFGGYDFYRLGWPVDRFTKLPPDGDELHEYIFERQLNSLEINGSTFVEWWAKLHLLPQASEAACLAVVNATAALAWPFAPIVKAILKEMGVNIGADFLGLGGPDSLLSPTKDQWSMIKDKLDREAAWPIGIIFSNKWNLFDQHQVLAIGYTDIGNGTATLTIWDNNDGRGSDIDTIDGSNTLSIDFRGDELEVSALPGSALADDQVKGIFLQEYVPQQPPLSLGPS